MNGQTCLALSLLLVATPALGEQYLCVPDKATGFVFNAKTNEWDVTQFKTDRKYIITPSKTGKDAFSLTAFGEKEPDGYCKDKFNEYGFLFCSTFGGEFKFNRTNGRFLMSFTLGYYAVGPEYWIRTDKESGTPMIMIGKCSPF